MKRLFALFLLVVTAGATMGGKILPAYAQSTPEPIRIFLPFVTSNGKPPHNPMYKGIAFPSWWFDEYSKPESVLSLREVGKVGATCVSLVVTWYQSTPDTTVLFPTSNTVDDASLIYMLSTASKEKFCTFLGIQVNVQEGGWTGNIGEAFTQAQVSEWFANYTELIVHYAEIAQAYGVDLLSVGSNLMALSGETSYWKDLVGRVKEVYKGSITYSANQEEFDTRDLWKYMDIIGINAYFELSDTTTPTLNDLKSSWKLHKIRIQEFRKIWKKQVVFTQIGYRSVDGSSMQPWNGGLTGPVDLQEQADCYQALFTSLWHETWFEGVFMWYWSPKLLSGGIEDTEFTPKDKPAQDILTQWWK